MTEELRTDGDGPSAWRPNPGGLLVASAYALMWVAKTGVCCEQVPLGTYDMWANA